jgi:hypothetical protein
MSEAPQSVESGYPADEPVRLLQRALRTAGYDPGAEDGVFGPRTEAAVRSFQKRVNITADGAVGPTTWQTLRKLTPELFSGPQLPKPLRKTVVSKAPPAESTPPPVEVADDTGTLLDRPAPEDELGRLAFARVIALRIRAVRSAYRAPGEPEPGWRRWHETAPGPFILHLDGAWGSGKSSLLGFLASELREPTMKGPDGREPIPWIVVEFNAWQHQRIAPPWWWLLNAVSLKGKRALWHTSKLRWLGFKASDLWWRLKHGWANLAGIAIGLVFVGFAALAAYRVFTTSHDVGAGLKTLAALASSLGIVIGLALTVLGITRGLRDWLLVRSAAGARDGLAHATDPLATVKSRYEHVVDALGRPLALIIDDLDRCQPKFVVELLEGIQTLYAQAPVTYVVAADSRWIRDCFEEEYKTFLDVPAEAGRPLGYHFLEKTFQLSADVPRLTDRLRRRYFEGLLGIAPAANGRGETAGEAVRATAQAGTEEELRSAVSTARTPEEEAAAVDEALLRAQSTVIRQHTEHRLQDFDRLLERNPRAMKRLINAYGLARDVELIESGAHVSTDTGAIKQLALWTILRLRWPLLAHHLEHHPADIEKVGGSAGLERVPEALREAFEEPDLIEVVNGADVGASLDAAAVTRIVRGPTSLVTQR